jgi:signal transduction histidine kinase
MNSVKHHDRDRGKITVTGRRDDDWAVISVADDGPGIPFDCRARVFEMFQTLRPRDEVEGSGMGLALVRKTVESHGGTVEIEAREGRGATFVMRWPLPANHHQDAA